jgi:hypothetical protein
MTDKFEDPENQEEEEGFDDEALEEEFDFDSEDLELESDPVEHLSEEALEESDPTPSKPMKKTSSGSGKAITGMIVLTILGIVGYKGYDILNTKEKTISAPQSLPPVATNNPSPIAPPIAEVKNEAIQPAPQPQDIIPAPAAVDDIAKSLPEPSSATQESNNWFDEQLESMNKPVPKAAPVIEAAAPSISNISNISKEELTALEAKLSNQNQKQSQRLDAIEGDMGKIINRMGELNQNITVLQQNLNQITASMKDFSGEVNKARQVAQQQKAQKTEAKKPEPAAAPTAAPVAAPAPAPRRPQNIVPTVSVHAIIPGRAWLRSDDGRIITVTQGDSIEGLGKVLRVDATEGVVVTSSGVTLR